MTVVTMAFTSTEPIIIKNESAASPRLAFKKIVTGAYPGLGAAKLHISSLSFGILPEITKVMQFSVH